MPFNHRAISDRLLAAACTTVIGAFLVNQIWDLDIWWHLAIGKDILARHAVPVTDHFTAAAFGRLYHDSHWMFQVVMALADQTAGMLGVQVMMILGWSAAFWFCWRSIAQWVSSPVSYLLLFLAAMASIERFTPRPEIATMLMITTFWWMLQQRKYENTKGLLLFGLLQVIWTNSHGLFVIGPFMAGCYWLAAALQKKQEGRQQDFVRLSQLLGVLLLATLISPYGWEGWRYAALIATETGPNAPRMFKALAELDPTFSATTRSDIAFWFFATLLATTILTVIPLALRRQISLSRLLIVAGLFAAAITGRRNMPLFALVAAPFVAENLRLLIIPPVKRLGRVQEATIKTAITVILSLVMLGWAWYPISGSYYLNMKIISRFGLGITPSFFPYGLPQFLNHIGFREPIYNSIDLGGFYLYHGYPERLPLTDGRWEAYDMKVLEAIVDARYNPTAWSWVVNTYGIRGLLLQHASVEAKELLPALRSQNDWRLVYYDHSASFWMRNDTPSLPPAIDLATAPLPPKPEQSEDCIMLNLFLSKMEAYQLKLQNLQRAIEFGRDMESLLTEIAQTQIKLRQLDQAESTLNRLLHDYPRNLYALNELGFLAYYQKGDLVTAEALLRRALEVAPDDADIRNNYLGVKTALDRSAQHRSTQKQGQHR